MHEKQQKGLLFKYHNTVELPMLGGDGPDDDAGAAGVDVGNRANNLYLKKNLPGTLQ